MEEGIGETKKLITMVREGEGDHSSAWEDEDDDDHQSERLIAPDSYDGIGSSGSSGDIVGRKKRKRKRKRKRKKKKNLIINYEADSSVKAEDYPKLVGKFLKYDIMDKELKEKWRVIGNENARKLEQEWIEIMEMQVEQALAKTCFIDDIYSLITDREEEEMEMRKKKKKKNNPTPTQLLN